MSAITSCLTARPLALPCLACLPTCSVWLTCLPCLLGPAFLLLLPRPPSTPTGSGVHVYLSQLVGLPPCYLVWQPAVYLAHLTYAFLHSIFLHMFPLLVCQASPPVRPAMPCLPLVPYLPCCIALPAYRVCLDCLCCMHFCPAVPCLTCHTCLPFLLACPLVLPTVLPTLAALPIRVVFPARPPSVPCLPNHPFADFVSLLTLPSFLPSLTCPLICLPAWAPCCVLPAWLVSEPCPAFPVFCLNHLDQLQGPSNLLFSWY
jgi:hypothetical protein